MNSKATRVTSNNDCSRLCCYKKHCFGYRTLQKQCPEWALDKARKEESEIASELNIAK